jgi:hypothetical protein
MGLRMMELRSFRLRSKLHLEKEEPVFDVRREAVLCVRWSERVVSLQHEHDIWVALYLIPRAVSGGVDGQRISISDRHDEAIRHEQVT